MTFAPLAHSSAFWALAAVAAALLVVYAIGSRRHLPGTALALRVLAVAALVIPAWTLVAWYRDLARAREVATRMAIQTEPILDRAVVNGAALLCLGFLVMIGGIWLARRVP
ncbi:MAG TPA: hypothetical protein VFH69_05055 [Gemmatimonadota bacterium]|nr:hypothetical protein [Gemmatimonadota bacterium]